MSTMAARGYGKSISGQIVIDAERARGGVVKYVGRNGEATLYPQTVRRAWQMIERMTKAMLYPRRRTSEPRPRGEP